MDTMDWRRKRTTCSCRAWASSTLLFEAFSSVFIHVRQRESKEQLFSLHRVCRDIFFFFPNPPFACVEARTRRNTKKVIGLEALFALGLKRWGKEVAKAMWKTFNEVDKNTRKIDLFEDSFFKTLGFGRHVEFYAAVAFCLATELQTKVP